jgi:hypothetical protein
MLEFLKKIFCAAEPDKAPAPYKVEEPKVEANPVAEAAPKKVAKKPAVKKATTRKPKSPKA